MRQLFLMVNDGSVKLIESPAPTVKDNTVIVETLYSLISAGTERGLTSFGHKNLIQKALARPEQVKKVVDKMSTDGVLTTLDIAFNKLNEPMPMGYSAVGVVKSCGKNVTHLAVGDRVAMVGQAYHAEVNRVNKNLVAKIPSKVKDVKQYAFCALAGVALEGIHQANVQSGETIAIIGLGLLGHIAARILHAYGCEVIAFDIADKTLPATPLKAFINSADETAEDKVKALTHGRGVDKVLIPAAADSNAPMDLAATVVRDRGTICMIGVTQMNIDRRPYYAKELTFTIARSYGAGRYDPNYEELGVDYPIGYVRFTEGRNVEEFVRLVTEGLVDCSDLITHVLDFDQAQDAYEMITTNKNHEKYIGVLLRYAERDEKWTGYVVKKDKKGTSPINVGLIGAGNFARTTILPNMGKLKEFHLKGLATTGGVGAAQTESRFDYLTNDYRELLADDAINLVIVSTNHNSHAKFICEALKAGKHVYCEKPLCLNLTELDAIEKTYRESKGELFCGMNRRFAPLVKKLRQDLNTNTIPAIYDYIVNAGYIPENHWTQNEKVGGGRIIGEACHFVDTIQYLDGSELLSIDIKFAFNEAYPKKDNALITLRFTSGAIANILYSSMGSKRYPKEQLKVFSNGSVSELNNYLTLTTYGSITHKTIKLRQDKGIYNEYQTIANVIMGKEENKAIEDAFLSHRLILEGLNNG